MKIRNSGRTYLVALIACWIVSRCFYFFYLGVRLDSSPLRWYLQYIDPALLKNALWQSIFYLNNQPPGFNLFLGVMLKLFGSHVGWAFQVVYWGFGLGLAIVLFMLLRRLGIIPGLALLITALFCISPITLLYENWLFYTYPLTFLLALSALFLHRYVIRKRAADAVLFFSTMAVIVLSRGVFHWAWLAVALLALCLVFAQFRRQLIAAAAVPCLLVAALYCKNYLVFGTMLSGAVYQQANFAMMVFNNLPERAKEQLIADGKVTELAGISPYSWIEEDRYRRLLPPIKRWGVPVLDQEVKSTGVPNWQSQLIAEFAQAYYRDAKVAVRQYPAAYLRAVVTNVEDYFTTADQTWPFIPGDKPSTTDANVLKMGKLLPAWNLLFAWQLPLGGFIGKVPWLNLIAFPVCFLFGCRWVAHWARGHKVLQPEDERSGANAAVILFMLYNIAYIAVVTILFSVSDHNRYRFKVVPFYAALLSLLLASRLQLFAKRRLARNRS